MSRDKADIPFFELLHAVWEGTSTPEQEKELEQILLSDPAARQTYYDSLDVDQGLSEIATFPRQLAPIVFPTETRSASWTKFVGYGLVAAASLAIGAALEWWIVGGPRGNRISHQQRIAVAPTVPQFVATLVRSTDCDWEHEKSPYFEGQRLLSSELQLNRGVAEFRMDTGIRLIVEGPTKLKFNSSRSAVLDFGKVVLHGSELADGFALITPQATLIDIGTEYGVTVDRQANVELHVFHGAVSIEPTSKAGNTGLVEEGGARRLSGKAVEEVPLRPDLFQREVPGRETQSSVSRDGLMAFDGFRAIPEGSPNASWHSMGSGWVGDWRSGKQSDKPSKGLFVPTLKLPWSEVDSAGSTGAITLGPERKVAFRTMQHPIRMNTNAIYYVSFFMKKLHDVPHEVTQYGSLSFRTKEEAAGSRRMVFGMSSQRMPILVHNEQQIQAAPPLQADKSYLYVAKIVAGENTPDEIQMRVFSADEGLLDQEPHIWTCASSPVYDDTVYDQLVLYVEGTEYAFDEIRVASSWQALTNLDWPSNPAESIPEN